MVKKYSHSVKLINKTGHFDNLKTDEGNGTDS